MILAAISDVVAAAPIAFIVGAFVGFLISNRYRVIKRGNGDPAP